MEIQSCAAKPMVRNRCQNGLRHLRDLYAAKSSQISIDAIWQGKGEGFPEGVRSGIQATY